MNSDMFLLCFMWLKGYVAVNTLLQPSFFIFFFFFNSEALLVSSGFHSNHLHSSFSKLCTRECCKITPSSCNILTVHLNICAVNNITKQQAICPIHGKNQANQTEMLELELRGNQSEPCLQDMLNVISRLFMAPAINPNLWMSSKPAEVLLRRYLAMVV